MSEENIFMTKRNIDVVFCIDGTGSMSPCIEAVKSNARRFRFEFVKAMSKMGSEIDSMRVKIIVFRDYECDGNESMQISPFFELPADETEFDKFYAIWLPKRELGEVIEIERKTKAITNTFFIKTPKKSRYKST